MEIGKNMVGSSFFTILKNPENIKGMFVYYF